MRVPDFFNKLVHPDIAPFGTQTTYELLTSLYGLKQAAYKYYERVSDVVLKYTDPNGYKYRRSEADPCVFTKGQLEHGTTTYIAFSMHIDDKFIASIISFIYFYFVIFFVLTALLSLTGLDFITAISGAATSISNVGPGLGPIIGPNGDFSSLRDMSKWILTVGMILGRLELFAILVLFLPSFWRS